MSTLSKYKKFSCSKEEEENIMPALEIAASQLCQFIEVCSHDILSKRGLYPDAIFVPRVVFGWPVKASIHPGVNAFIEDCLDGLLIALQTRESKVSGIDLVIIDFDGDYVEKYAFRFGHQLTIKHKEKFVLADPELRPVDLDPPVQLLLRNSLMRLTTKMNNLKPIENVKGCHFNFHIHTDANTGIKVTQDTSVSWEMEENSEFIMDFIAQKMPVMSVKDNPYHFTIHVDLFNKDMQT